MEYLDDRFHDAIYFFGGESLFGKGSFKCVKVHIQNFLLRACFVVSEYVAVDNRFLGVFEGITRSVKVSLVIRGFLV